MSPSRTRLLHLGIVAAAAAAVYSNTFAVPFQFDDSLHVARNPAVRDLGTFLASPHPARRWVAYLTFALNGSVHGLSVAGYHAVNLAIHVATGACVYLLALLVARRARFPADGGPGAPLAALVAAVLFVVHPVQTQAVTYVVQRMASLAALLYVGAVLCHAHGALAASGRARAAFRAASVALAVLAVLTKEHAVTVPAAAAVLDLAVLPGRHRERAARLAPLALAALAAAVPILLPGGLLGGTVREFAQSAPGGAGPPSRGSYLVSQVPVLVAYLRLLVLPVGQTVDHDVPLRTSPLDPAVLGSAALLLLALGVPAALAWRARARSGASRVVLLAVGWFVVALSVESVVPLADLLVEHRLYLPSVGPCVLAGAAAAAAVQRARSRRLALAAVALPLAVLAGAAHARNRVWRDPWTLWSDAREKAPGSSRPPVWLGQLLLERGDVEGAARLFEVAVGLRPVLPHQFHNLAVAYWRLGRREEAERAFRRALSLPVGTAPGTRAALGLLLLEQDRIAEACPLFEEEVAVDPANVQARENHGTCLWTRGDAAGAIAQWSRVAELEPGNAPVLYNLALALSARGDAAAAADAWRRFLAAAGDGLPAQRAEAARWLSEHAGAGGARP